jgi:hypothetical protein
LPEISADSDALLLLYSLLTISEISVNCDALPLSGTKTAALIAGGEPAGDTGI